MSGTGCGRSHEAGMVWVGPPETLSQQDIGDRAIHGRSRARLWRAYPGRDRVFAIYVPDEQARQSYESVMLNTRVGCNCLSGEYSARPSKVPSDP